VLISHHFHNCKAPLARASHVKWRYTKYLGFSFLAFLRGTILLRIESVPTLEEEKEEVGHLVNYHS